MIDNGHSNSDAVAVEVDGPVLWARLNRPHTMNGLNQDILDGLDAALDLAEADRGIHCVVITGRGKAFCAGADLRYAQTLTAQEVSGRYSASQLFLRRTRTVLDRVEAFPKPTIAAVQGITVGGGLELVLCCDIALAARSARIGDGHANYAQIPGGGASARLPQRIGVAKAKYLMFTGQLFKADYYADTDLLTTVVDDSDLENEVKKIADVISTKSPAGIARMKMLVNDCSQVPRAIALTMELEQSALHEQSADWAEGIAAFNDKRTPHYSGK